jgi:uncharacterized protein (TIGR02001 family)
MTPSFLLSRSLPGALAAATLLFGISGALAADATESTADRFDVAFGATLTTDYISNGITQSDHGPAIQGYIEPSYGIFYGGAWVSTVKFDGEAGDEVHFYAGVRPEFGPLSFDLSLLHGYYTNELGEEWNEFDGFVEYGVNDTLKLGAGVVYNFTSEDVTPEVSASVALPHDFELSARLAYYDYADDGLHDYLTWDAGVSWTWADSVKLDLRYYDTALSESECLDNAGSGKACDARIVASVSVDTSILKLKEGFK